MQIQVQRDKGAAFLCAVHHFVAHSHGSCHSRTMKYIKQENAAAKGRAGERRAGDASCWRPKRKADLTLQSLRFLQKDGKAPGHQRTRNRAR